MTPIRTTSPTVDPASHRISVIAPIDASVVALWRVRAVIPCFNRRADLLLLLADLAALNRGPGRIDLSVTVIDNASDPPLSLPDIPALGVEILRLPRNSGGSGGFNAGMAAFLSRGVPADACEFLWLLDSDVRLDADALLPLLDALEHNPDLAAAGSALIDPQSGRIFEGGGRIGPRTGEYEQPWTDDLASEPLIPADYLAACSLLVRRAAAEQTGPMADLFLNGDDVEWSIRMRRRTGQRLAAIPASRARHPHPDRMRTAARYYAARNAFAVLESSAAPRWPRLVRALRETARAAAQLMVGRDDLAALHLRGLRDARLRIHGPAPDGALRHEPWRSTTELPGALRQVLAVNPPRGRVMIRKGLLPDQPALSKSLNALCIEPVLLPEPDEPQPWLRSSLSAIQRLFLGAPWGVAVVSARARPADWLAARAIATAGPDGFILRRISRPETAIKLASTLSRGLWHSAALALRAPRPAPIDSTAWAPRRTLTLSVIILSYNRWSVLARTLAALLADPALAGAEIIVADNGSTDGSPDRIRERFPRVRLIQLNENLGVEAFNRAAATATGEALLILDDDAVPADGVLERALDTLSRRPDLGAVALHPRHPETHESEWPFGEGSPPRDDWPVMGCANLIRRAAWARAGGYCGEFFLYRNDADLAMTLLECGHGIHFDPALVARHDSPAAAKKSLRWFHLATRNWVWLCRRHGRGLSRPAAIILGALHAHRLAARDRRAHAAILRGLWDGLRHPAPKAAEGARRDGSALRTLLRARLGRRSPRPR